MHDDVIGALSLQLPNLPCANFLKKSGKLGKWAHVNTDPLTLFLHFAYSGDHDDPNPDELEKHELKEDKDDVDEAVEEGNNEDRKENEPIRESRGKFEVGEEPHSDVEEQSEARRMIQTRTALHRRD